MFWLSKPSRLMPDSLSCSINQSQPPRDLVDLELGCLVGRLLAIPGIGDQHRAFAANQQIAGRPGETGEVPPVFRSGNQDRVHLPFGQPGDETVQAFFHHRVSSSTSAANISNAAV